jgi:hypothetical protein
MEKISNIISCKGILCILFIFWQTSVAANTITGHLRENNHHVNKKTLIRQHDKGLQMEIVKLIQIKIVELTDNSGLTYIGGKVSAAALVPYLSQMQQRLGDDFVRYRQKQSARDHQSFHMTLINPYEYQSLTKSAKETLIKTATSETLLSVSLHGLARVSVDNKTSYFVVANSSQAKNYRQRLGLTDKDFHVTLGFNPNDIYGVNKGIETLIN